ncbi:MAG: minor capsid protein [Chloroflexota bacterium]
MTEPKIETPQGKIVKITTTGGKIEVRLEWDTKKFISSGSGGGRRGTNDAYSWQGRFSNAQWFVDNEVLRLSEPFTPLLTSMLIKSGALGTDIGSGTVQWIAPYARAQYYGHRSPGSQTGPLRGPQWFARMKEIHGEKIIAGARRIAGKGTK